MKNKVLIAYASKFGATEDTAKKIASILASEFNLDVQLINLCREEYPEISPYMAVIVGNGIRFGKWYKDALDFRGSDFQGKKVAIFVSSWVEAGKPETYPKAVELYLNQISKNYLKNEPVAAEAFGGVFKIMGHMTSDNRNMNKITAWAKSLGAKLAPEVVEMEVN